MNKLKCLEKDQIAFVMALISIHRLHLFDHFLSLKLQASLESRALTHENTSKCTGNCYRNCKKTARNLLTYFQTSGVSVENRGSHITQVQPKNDINVNKQEIDTCV